MDAIKKDNGPCVILAGAGTGKTYTIVEKLKHLIKDNVYDPTRIVCITFSNEAANNLFSRVQAAVHLEPGKEPIIKTFHSFSSDLLRKYGNLIGVEKEFSILDPTEAKVILHRNFKVTTHNCHRYISSIGMAKDLGISIDKLKDYLKKKDLFGDELESKLEDLQFRLQTLYLQKEKEKKKDLECQIDKMVKILDLKKFIGAWEGYEKIKVKRNYLDYSDLNKIALELVLKNPNIANDFDYIIVDEFQDTNKLQLDLIIALCKNNNITVVGDMNQSIYRFRGAYKENFNIFKKHFNISQKEIFNLDKSFRSPNSVLRAAHRLILRNYDDPSECFLVENAHKREGDKIEVYELDNSKEEARKVVEIVERELARGIKMEEICVMFRTHQQGRIIRNALEYKKIPFSSVSKSSLFNQKSVKTVIDYLTIVHNLVNRNKGGEQAWWDLFYNMGFPVKDLISIGRFMKENKECENISAKILSSLDKINLSDLGRLHVKIILERVKRLIPFAKNDSCEFIHESFSICGLVNGQKTKEEKELMLNLNKFYDLAKTHSAIHSPDIGTFLNYLEILSNLGIEVEAAEVESGGVRLMTLHSTKGLEYKVVIVTNMVQKRFPMEKYNSNNLVPFEVMPELENVNLTGEDLDFFVKSYELKNQLLEERRLCYVAFTRAREKLILTYAKEYNSKKFLPSEFLNEVDYKKNEDFVFFVDKEIKYQEPEVKIVKASNYNYLLNSDNLEDVTIEVEESIDKSPIRKDITFSPSALLLFTDCQKKYEYQYVYNMPEKKTFSWDAIRLGSFVHKVLDEGVRRNFKELKLFIDFARELYSQDDWQTIELADALHLIKVFFERNKNKYNEFSKTEQLLRVRIEDLTFLGFADRIDFSDKGIEIIDYKTGKNQIAPQHRNWQLGYYAIAAKELGLGNVRKITLDMLKLDKPLEFEVDDKGVAHAVNGNMMFDINQIREEIVETAKKVMAAYKDGFKPCPIEKNCEFCNEYVYDI